MTKKMLEEIKSKLMNNFLVSNNMISDEMAQFYKKRLNKLYTKLARLENLPQGDFQESFYRQKEEILNAKIKECDKSISEYRECINLLKSKKGEFEDDMKTAVLDAISYYTSLKCYEIDNKSSLMREYCDVCSTAVEDDIASIKHEIAHYEDVISRYKANKSIIENECKRIDSIFASIETED